MASTTPTSVMGSQGKPAKVNGSHYQLKPTKQTPHPAGSKTGNVKGKHNHA